ncbi:hypothetical protein [Streptomyces sp. NPDC049813]|uniref:hypothetical protein n=1 Tax=Streptomyces sp. NPDC049813 TaxID=3365597 RepID=UPI0037A2863E
METMNRTTGAPARTGLLVAAAVLTVVSAGLLAAHFAFDGDTYQNCRYLGPSTRMYVTAWAGPPCAVAALVLAARSGPRRPGGRAAVVCVAALLLLAQIAALYWVYGSDPAGGADCSGLAALLR